MKKGATKEIKCRVCKKVIEKGSYCSKKCVAKVVEYNRQLKAKKMVEKHFCTNEFSKKKKYYADKIISYADSPTGGAYIGFAKRPLMESDNGVGFKGVLLQSENRELVLCNECGEWLKVLSASHLKRHGMPQREYKDKHGLNRGTALISDVYSNWCAENVTKYLMDRQQINTVERMNTIRKLRTKTEQSIENQNLNGTCVEQIKDQLRTYVLRHKMLPVYKTCAGRGKYLWDLLYKRFGSVNDGFAYYGLPYRQVGGAGTHYIFPDKTKYLINIRKGIGSHEELFSIMKGKCSLLAL